MTSSNGNIFRITGPLCGNSPVTGEFPSQRPVARSIGVFFNLRLNKLLSKQSIRRWFETPSCSLWRHCNVPLAITAILLYLFYFIHHGNSILFYFIRHGNSVLFCSVNTLCYVSIGSGDGLVPITRTNGEQDAWRYASLASGRCGDDFKSVNSEHMLRIKFMRTSCDTVLR